MRKQIPFFVFATLCATLIAGCSSPPYREARASGLLAAPKDKGLVLIYWPSTGSAGSENTNTTQLYANDKLIEKHLRPGSFHSYYAEPGSLRISSGAFTGNKPGDYVKAGIWGGTERMAGVYARQKVDRVVVEVKPGEIYFLETSTGMFAEKITPVSRAEGERRMQDCRWLNPR